MRASPGASVSRPAQIDEMYQIMAIANYEDRFVIPTAHREFAENAYDLRGSCGFSFGNGCSGGTTEATCSARRRSTPRRRWRSCDDKTFKVLSALLSYPDAGAAERPRRRLRRRHSIEEDLPAAGQAARHRAL